MNIKNFYMLCALCCFTHVQLKSMFSAGLTYTDRLLQMETGDKLWNEIKYLKDKNEIKVNNLNQLKNQSENIRKELKLEENELTAKDYNKNFAFYMNQVYNARNTIYDLHDLYLMKEYINHIPAFNDQAFEKYNKIEYSLLIELYPWCKGYSIENKPAENPDEFLSNRSNNIVFEVKKNDSLLKQEEINATLLDKIKEKKTQADQEYKEIQKKIKLRKNAIKMHKLEDSIKKTNSKLIHKQSFLNRLFYKFCSF